MVAGATVYAVANQKGGVAKTTTAVSITAALAERELAVLVVDPDPQADLTFSLGYDPSPGVLTLNGLMAADRVAIPMQCETLSHRGVSQLLETGVA